MAHSEDLSVLTFNNVVRNSQGVLNWHIQQKIASGATQGLIKSDLCFVKVSNGQTARIELYQKACPSDLSALSRFRESSASLLVNSFELSLALQSTASAELKDLEDEYGEELPLINQRFVQIARELVPGDSLGSLIFMKLGDQKVSVGYVDNRGRVMELCSGAWENICYMKDGVFKLGQEIVERNWDSQKSDWEWPRTYVDFTELVAGTVYTRGNDDSRDQVIYMLTLPKTGKQVPISEEWYLYFSLNPKTRHLVKLALDDNGIPLKSMRTRSEWNYMTAIHPIHVFKTKSPEGEVSYRLYMGASVFYNENLGIEEADCDMSESEGFELHSLSDLDRELSPLSDTGVFSDLETKLYFGSFENAMEHSRGSLNKTYPASFIGKKNNSNGEDNPPEVSQQKYLPNSDSVKGLKLFGMNAVVDLGNRLTPQSFAVIKGVSGDYSRSYSPEQKKTLQTIFNQNMLKEFLTLEKTPEGRYSLRLAGFNPNEMLATNTAEFDFQGTPYSLKYDPMAVTRVWASGSESFAKTHIASRDTAESLRKLKLVLRGKRYKAQSSLDSLRNVDRIAEALLMGQEISLEDRDWYVSQLDKDYRFVGKNVFQAFGVRGRGDYLTDLYRNVRFNTVADMGKETWVFPKYYLRIFYEGEEEKREIVEAEDTTLDFLRDFVKTRLSSPSSEDLLFQDNELLISRLLNDEKFLETTLRETKTIASFEPKLQKIIASEGYFESFRSYAEVLKRVSVATLTQLQSMGTLIARADIYAFLKPYARVQDGRRFLGLDTSRIYTDINQCYLEADADMEKIQACYEKYSEQARTLDSLCTELRLPQSWEMR
ncbi:MAG: hypothetical protein R3A80_02190 [Bdellovibrionota bacterium]